MCIQLRLTVNVCGLCLVMCAAAYAQGHTLPTPRAVKTVVGPWIENFDPPGSLVIVHREGQTEFFPHGEANRTRHVAVSPDSIFELASITKVFTTTSLAIEVEEGRMQLTDPVDKYLPVLREGGDIRRVTLEQLATHTSSLPRTPGSNPRGANQRGPWDREEVMNWLVHWRAPYPPGTKSLYSNLAVGVLGDAIAAHAQKPLQEVWERQFLHVLDMKSTFFEIPEQAAGRLVQGYGVNGRPVNRAPVPGGWPAGGRLCSSGRDMARFLAANLGEEPSHKLITKAMHLAQRPHFKASERMTQGLSWQRVHIDDKLVIDKNGGLAGTSTYIGMIPAKRLGVVVLANRGKAEATGVGRRLLITLAGGTPKADMHAAEEEDAE
jgi:beta-lactamase class C